ncbi:hypothetical protein [Fischerella thermalis]|uniref:Restriction endonuclease subunit M n=1 Tax=Fischerella thermalis CCMEE 5318 TaxID=2019666 RepID=A0A2N6LCU7_9CYAN|nr:hypothetical protein [Fischerella thermalis]PMB20759.1 hypothetical protein CEN46_15840 [Fischerella thermalis CCMEE 5318]
MSKEFGDFQTPPALVADVLKCLNVSGERWKRVLEPTCGSGNFISALLALPVPFLYVPLQLCDRTSSLKIPVLLFLNSRVAAFSHRSQL